MREISKESIISCQLSYYPLAKNEYINDIDEILDIISKGGLEFTVGDMSTVIKGEISGVYGLLSKISEIMDAKENKYSMTLTISNTCGLE